MEKIATLESLLVAQEGKSDLQEKKIKELIQDKKKLEQKVGDYKWKYESAKGHWTIAKNRLKKARKEIEAIKEALRVARLPKNSSNSSLPPSSDLFKPKRNKNYSLRRKSGRKPGGQAGHKGATLEFSTAAPDQEMEHAMELCGACGRSLTDVPGEKVHIHQVVDIAIPKKVLINHTTVSKQCSCGHCNHGVFPPGTEGQVNYGNRVRGLIANLSVRQYMPYKRTVEFMEDIFDISMSEGTVTNLLGQFERSAAGEYNRIRNQVFHSPVVGSDETSAKVNGTKDWFHTYQTPEHTFIGYHPSRGTRAQKQFYPDGLPNSILVSDCLPMQLSTPAAAHQVCHVHILRELHAMEENHPEQSWPGKMKDVILKAIDLRKYPHSSEKVKVIEKKFDRLIKTNQSNAPGKIPAFWKRMNRHKDKVFTFLHYRMVPAENNASERAIRNVKVKQKVSGQFKTSKGAYRYAMIRSIIDTMIKQNKNVHEGLSNIASLIPA